MDNNQDKRITLRDVKKWVETRRTFAMLTCYDATTVSWLYRGGVRTFLVGDTAAQMILGHDSTIYATMPFLLELTAAVRRGAPNALIMADMPFGSYQCGDDEAMRHAASFLTQGLADWVKLEVDASFAPLVERMNHAGIPVVAHIGSRPQQIRAEGGHRAAGRTQREADQIVEIAKVMIQAGAKALLVEAVPAEVGKRIVDAAVHPDTGEVVPVIGCGAGPDCHGHVVVLQDMLGMTDWQPPFAKPLAQIGQAIQQAATDWVNLIESGNYLKERNTYKMRD